MSRFAVFCIFCVVSLVVLSAQTEKPARTVSGNVIISTSPQVRIALPKEARYIGADRWPLYDVADCEIHVFVKANQNNVIQQMFWVQFEEFLPGKPELKYNYSSDPIQQLHGFEFHVKARFGPSGDSVKPGSDAEHVRQLVRRAGYNVPPDMMNVRLVHLPDQQRRRELMIIYAEDLAPAGVVWTDLMPGGKAASEWPDLQASLITRAEQSIRLNK